MAYLVTTILAAVANGCAALMNFAGAQSVKDVADRLHVSRRWMIPFGILLASGAVGLVTGFWLTAPGVAAAIGLVLYFVCALGAHIRARDAHVGGAITFLVLAVAALLANIGYHGQW